MGKFAVLALRAVVAVLIAGSLCVQTVMVSLLADGTPEGVLADRRVPIVVIVVLGIVAAQVVLVCVWQLAGMVRRGTVFSHAAFRYMHIVIGAFVAAALLVFALGMVLAPDEAVAPGIVLLMGGVCMAVFAVALIVWVLWMLLGQAVARDVEAARMRAELEEVI
ncbi:DUF2975 domain-containing protein [Streptomyces sp. NPDC085932]|uniref:DUF2975 domain-containing protein n=1 Tax=Streptomyces sp. NPDC085932 TaxID=3365741 RepID=UPI0037CE237A